MPTIEVVRIEDIPSSVERTLKGIVQGVRLSIKAGIKAELPEKVDFNMVVIDKWQELEVVSGNEEESSQIEGGATTEKSTRESRGTTAGTSVKTDFNENLHEEKGASTTTNESED